MEPKKCDANEFFTKYKYKLTKKTNLWLPTKKVVRRGKLGVWD